MKKLLSFILCLAMLCSLGLGAFASEEPSSAEPAEDLDEYTLAVAANGGNAGSLGHVVAEAPAGINESATTTFPDEYPREMIYKISDEEMLDYLRKYKFSEKQVLDVPIRRPPASVLNYEPDHSAPDIMKGLPE